MIFFISLFVFYLFVCFICVTLTNIISSVILDEPRLAGCFLILVFHLVLTFLLSHCMWMYLCLWTNSTVSVCFMWCVGARSSTGYHSATHGPSIKSTGNYFITLHFIDEFNY